MTLTKIGASLGGGADTVFITQAGHGLTLGYPVKANGNGTYAHATADTAANAEAIGIIIESTTDTMRIALSGRVTVDGCVPNLSAGTVLFLQVSAGLLAAAEPSGNNQVSKPMAVITYANSEMILLSHRGEVISTAGITLADESVDSDHYVDGSIDRVHLAADIIDGTKIADDVINSEHYAAASIDNEHLADDAVGVAELSATGTASSSTFLRGDNAWAAAGPTEATQANMVAEATGTLYSPPDLTKHSPGVAKAYCHVTNAAGAPATGSYNVASGAKNSTGNYTMTWDVDFANTNYTALAAIIGGDSRTANVQNLATGTCDVFTFNSNADETKEVSDAMLVAFGEAA